MKKRNKVLETNYLKKERNMKIQEHLDKNLSAMR